MTRQVLAHQPYTQAFRSPEGGPLIDTPITIDGNVYSDVDCKDKISKKEQRTNGAGEFTFYGKPGTVVSFSTDLGQDVEPVQFIGAEFRPGGLAAVHPDNTPEVHEQSAVSELVSDASLVGAPGFPFPEEEGGYLAATGVMSAQVIPPGDPAPGTPDGTTATDPDAAAPPVTQEQQVTPQYEPVPDDSSHMEPEHVEKVDPPEPDEGK